MLLKTNSKDEEPEKTVGDVIASMNDIEAQASYVMIKSAIEDTEKLLGVDINPYNENNPRKKWADDELNELFDEETNRKREKGKYKNNATVGDIINAMTAEKREAMEILIGTAIETTKSIYLNSEYINNSSHNHFSDCLSGVVKKYK